MRITSLMMNFSSTVFAHEVQTRDVSTSSLSSIDPLPLLLFIFAGCLYVHGRRTWRGNFPLARWRQVSFFFGLTLLVVISAGPVHDLADRLFSVHMMQHLLITSVAVPLLLLGSPFIVFLRALPESWRTRHVLPTLRAQRTRGLVRALARPVLAAVIFEATLWFWHLPKFYDLALLNPGFHILEHACMALAAFNLWRVLIDPYPFRAALPLPLRLPLIAFLMTLDMVLSAALTYSPRVWYAYQKVPLPHDWPWDRLDDQRLGGLIMWVPGSAIWVLALILIFACWVRESEHVIS
jgi:cytochrome c oxidase assembly factor CtaG